MIRREQEAEELEFADDEQEDVVEEMIVPSLKATDSRRPSLMMVAISTEM